MKVADLSLMHETYPQHPAGVPSCGNRSSPPGFICTREPHTNGPHVAHAWRETACAYWYDDGGEPTHCYKYQEQYARAHR